MDTKEKYAFLPNTKKLADSWGNYFFQDLKEQTGDFNLYYIAELLSTQNFLYDEPFNYSMFDQENDQFIEACFKNFDTLMLKLYQNYPSRLELLKKIFAKAEFNDLKNASYTGTVDEKVKAFNTKISAFMQKETEKLEEVKLATQEKWCDLAYEATKEIAEKIKTSSKSLTFSQLVDLAADKRKSISDQLLESIDNGVKRDNNKIYVTPIHGKYSDQIQNITSIIKKSTELKQANGVLTSQEIGVLNQKLCKVVNLKEGDVKSVENYTIREFYEEQCPLNNIVIFNKHDNISQMYIFHLHGNFIKFSLATADAKISINKILLEKDQMKQLELIGEVFWNASTIMPYKRGVESCAMMTAFALMKACGLEINPFESKQSISPGFLACLMSRESFMHDFPSLIGFGKNQDSKIEVASVKEFIDHNTLNTKSYS